MAVQLIGRPINEVGMDVVPANMRHIRFQELGDLAVTQEMKQVIVRSANHALEDPWTVPAAKQA